MKMRTLLLIGVTLAACSKNDSPATAPSSTQDPAPSVAASPSTLPEGPRVAPSTPPAGSAVAPAPKAAKTQLTPELKKLRTFPNGLELERDESMDFNCDAGKKAYTASTRLRLPEESGCDGPMLAHYTIKDPKTGEMVDAESPVFCCSP